MFSETFDQNRIMRLFREPPELSMERVKRAFSQPPSLENAARLILAGSADRRIRQFILEKITSMRTTWWCNRLFLMPPLYISDGDPEKSGCMDHCIYCPWRNGNVPKNQLVRLNEDEIAAETQVLLDMGYEDVELVAATDPELLCGSGAAKVVQAARKVGAKSIGINFFPLPKVEDYKAIAEAGCKFTIVWQETYDQTTYKIVHPKGPKSNMSYRLDAHDRACQGGIKTVGLAFLGGLCPGWRFETLACMAHAEYLTKEYGCRIIFGMPRWKGQAGSSSFTAAPYAYDEEMYAFVGALYSWMFPSSMPWFSTREDFELSAQAAKGGGCLFTLTCSTVVGGYTRQGAAQFPVFSRGYKEGVTWLKEKGFSVETTLP